MITILFIVLGITGCSKNRQENKLFQIPPPIDRPAKSNIKYSDFIGSKQCEECHKDIYNEWRNSTHGNAGGSPENIVVVAPFDGNPILLADVSVFPEEKNEIYQFRIIDNETHQETVIKVEAVVGGGFMFGGGTQTFFGKYEDGSYKFIPFDYSQAENTWFIQIKGTEEWVKATNQIWLDQLFNWPPHRVLGEIENISNCQNCHGSQIVGKKVGEKYQTKFTSLTINCESCHEAGKAHFDIMTDIENGKIKNPTTIGVKSLAGLSKEESLNVCFQCHAVKTPLKYGFLPGENLHEYYSLRLALLGNQNPYGVDGRIKTFGYQQNHLYSDCFINGSMTCISCHEPHTQNYQDINRQKLIGRFDDRQCTSCHTSKIDNVPAHTFHKENSDGSKCVTCHMPFRQHAGIGQEIKFTRSDHTISNPRPIYDQSQGFESACFQCHKDLEEPALQLMEDSLQIYANQWWGEGKPMNPVITNRLLIRNETSMKQAEKLLLRPELTHSIGQYANVGYFIKRYLSPGMALLDRSVIDKLIDYAEQNEDIDLKALAIAGLHYSQYQNPEIQLFLTEQLETMGANEESIRRRWGLILDYFGTVFYLIGDRPSAIECYELAKQVLPNDKQITENLLKAKT
ncbi:MAG: hypothetical protein H8E56_00630 [Candidatus Marinimicrobia bacterium]|nr:hypothetical protein [Candidatus Neomarinimicrobiota bacterium]